MKRIVASLVLATAFSLSSVAGALPANAAQVFCRVPTAHKVVCYNYTDYAVHMRIVVDTSAGPRYFSGWQRYTRWVRYFSPRVYSVAWRWHF